MRKWCRDVPGQGRSALRDADLCSLWGGGPFLLQLSEGLGAQFQLVAVLSTA